MLPTHIFMVSFVSFAFFVQIHNRVYEKVQCHMEYCHTQHFFFKWIYVHHDADKHCRHYQYLGPAHCEGGSKRDEENFENCDQKIFGLQKLYLSSSEMKSRHSVISRSSWQFSPSNIGSELPADIIVMMVKSSRGASPQLKQGNMALNTFIWDRVQALRDGLIFHLLHILSKILNIIFTFSYWIMSSFLKFPFLQIVCLILTTAVTTSGHSEERGK